MTQNDSRLIFASLHHDATFFTPVTNILQVRVVIVDLILHSLVIKMIAIVDLSQEGVAVVIVALTLLYFVWRQVRRHLETKKPFGDQLPMPPGSHFFFGHLGMFGNDFRSVHQKM